MYSSIRSSFSEIKGHGRRGQLQFRCFFLTFLAHGSTFFTRKALAVIKHDLSESMDISLPFLGWLDAAMLFPIAIFQIFLVNYVYHVGPRKVLAWSLILTSFSLCTVGHWNSYRGYIILLFLGGSSQSLVFPYSISALSSWYNGRGRSAIFGVWGICVFLGSILGTTIAVESRILVGWDYVFLMVSAIVFLCGLSLFRLRMPSGTTQRPLVQIIQTSTGSKSSDSGPSSEVVARADTFSQSDRAMTIEEEQRVVSAGVYVVDSVPQSRRLGAMEVARLEMVPDIAAAYFCVNVIRFCVYMWLPLFFERTLGHPRGMSGYLSLAFEIGGLFGSPALGFISDSLLSGKKMLVCLCALIGSAICCALFYFTATWGIFFNALFLFLAGAGNGGTDLILSGTVAVDLGEAEDCITSVSGFVSGFGVMGAVVQGPLVAFAVHHYGESGIFLLLTWFAIAPIIAVARTLKLDERSRARVSNAADSSGVQIKVM